MARVMNWEYLTERDTKDNIDLMVCVVCAFMWIRMFYYSFFLEKVSKMLITLLAMFYDVFEFLFIMVLYILMATLVFQTLYQNRNENYGNLV